MRPANRTHLQVQVGAVGHRATWLPVQDFAAAARACRDFIDTNDFGASRWRGGKIVDTATRKAVATVSYNGRVWLPDGTEVRFEPVAARVCEGEH